MISKNTVLLVAVLGTVASLTWFKFSKDSLETVSKDASENSFPKSSNSTSSNRIKVFGGAREGWLDQTTKSLRDGSGSDFARIMQKANSANLLDISAAILAAHKEQPADTIAWLEELSVELTALDAHDRAALLLDLLSPLEEASTITGEVFSDWIQTDSAGTFSFLKGLSEEDEISHWQLSVVAELFQGQHVDLFDTYQTWIDESDSDLNLKGSLVEALVPHLLPENVDAISEIIIENLEHEREFGFALSRLAQTRSPENPVQNLEWLSKLDLPRSQIGTQVAAFGAAIEHIARNDIDTATQVMNQEDFLSNYYPGPPEALVDENGDWSGDARWFFDEVLTRFIEEVRETDLELARNSVESIFDPIRREESRLSFQEEEETAE